MRQFFFVAFLGLSLIGCRPAADTAGTPPERSAASPAEETPVMPADAPPQEEADPQVSIPEGPDMAPVRVPADDVACRQTLGETASARLVERCIAVSPATRPPCNAANTCEMIQNEIDRSCAMYGPGETPPDACAA